MKITCYSQFYTDRKLHGTEYAARHASEMGFDSVEYLSAVPSGNIRTADEERKILKSYGLDVACYSVMSQLFAPDQNELERQMFEEIQTAAALGSKLFHHTLYPHISMEKIQNSYDEVFDRIVDSAERIANKCSEMGLLCLYEPQGMYFNGVDGLKRIYDALKARGCDIGICGDFGNSLFVDVDPYDVFKSFSRDIRHVHVKDYMTSNTPLTDRKSFRSRGGKFIYEASLGEGVVDFSRGFDELKKAGYDGAVSFEINGSDEELTKAIRFIKNIAAKPRDI